MTRAIKFPNPSNEQKRGWLSLRIKIAGDFKKVEGALGILPTGVKENNRGLHHNRWRNSRPRGLRDNPKNLQGCAYSCIIQLLFVFFSFVGVQEYQASDIEIYHCPNCQLTQGPLVLKKRRNWHRHDYSEQEDSCKGACVLGINSPAVTIKNIECAIIDHAFEMGWIKPEIPHTHTGKKISVIGSGPAGLAAAAQLNKAGHTVMVYERNDRVGGLLRYGIPTMKLGKDVVQRRVDLMTEEGITFVCGQEVGKDLSACKIMEESDAMVLALGATYPRDLPIPGRNLNGIHFAMSFLETWQKVQSGNEMDYLKLYAKDKDVVIIGGGDTGCDCIATSLRQGAKSITSFEILPPPPPTWAANNPWPTWPRVFKVDYGHEEVKIKFGKDPRIFNIKSTEFVDDGKGNVSGIKTIKVEWKKDEAGRWNMSDVPGSEEFIKCDLVLLAMGFLGPEKKILEELKAKLDPRGNLETPRNKYSTSIPNVYAAGDCRRGQSLVVWAISEGRQAARQVDFDLMGPTSLAGPGGIVYQPEQ
ncbi:uncharacterized protein LOC133179675 [Saccostrea echinata]|uniref:uncharacterized protein LOC133179675 n=1 Tax=Saccostrea echinata TaxID=191078 RepID=UPI002A82FE5E|nr:uncharacterized protein LOC133179675 [Saccostrea echinata]